MEDAFLGQIIMFGGNFAPRGWAYCDGQLLSIAQNTALFSLLGTTYGGDGRTTFALPDLRGRAPIHAGTGPGLTTRRYGSRGGQENTTINITNLPNHTHAATFTQTGGVTSTPVVADEANSEDPTNNKPAIPNIGGSNLAYSNATSDGNLANGTARVTGTVQVASTGNQQPFNNMQPYLTVHYIIALIGTFPSRS